MLAQDTTRAAAAEVLVHMNGLSYEAYFKKVQELVGVLRNNWRQEQRVKTLKVAIQLSKLLADSSQPRLYAKKHRMITESLDEFGRLVHDRVHSIASGKLLQRSMSSSSSSFAYDDDDSGQQVRRANNKSNSNHNKNKQQSQQDDHHELAKDICRNWFLKVASIRELVPRFYIELAILKACDILFVQDTTSTGHLLLEQFFLQTLRRLSETAWGFGNPIVALNARAYLCQVAGRLLDYRKSSISTTTKSTQLFGGIILTNLNYCATLVRRLDIDSVLEATGQHSGTPPIQANQGAGYVPTVSFSNRVVSVPTDPGGDLCIELISSPIASILYVLVSKFDEGNDLKLDTRQHVAISDSSETSKIEQHLQRCMQELLDNLAQGEQECCAYRRNVILSAICRSLPSELAPFRAQRLMYELRVGYDKWKHDEIKFEINLRDQQQQQQDEQNEAPKLAQVVIISFYSALTNLMIALDGCELLDCERLKLDDSSTTNGQSNSDETPSDKIKPPNPDGLLTAAETMLNELGELYQIYEENWQANAHHLKCFKAILTYANHYVNETAVDRLLRDYLARFGLRPSRRNCRANRNVNHSQHYHNRHRLQQKHAIHLLDIIKTLFTSRTNLAEFERILALGSFNQLFGCIQKDDHKLDAAKWILESMRANIKLNNNKDTSRKDNARKGSSSMMVCITNREMINFLLKLFQTINDTLSPLADQDELEHLGKLVVFYLDLISWGDINEKLEFYSRCRSAMGNLHLVLEYLIRQVFDLPDAHKLVEKKRAARQNFLNGCLAFAFSTIPALHNNPLARLDLYQLGCGLALERSSLSLADYYMKQIMATFIGLVQDSKLYAFGGGNDGDHHCNARPVLNQDQTEKRLSSLLELMLKHQDHIDLKHKMALSELIKGSFVKCSSLLQRLKHLNCIERYVNDDDLNDNNDV